MIVLRLYENRLYKPDQDISESGSAGRSGTLGEKPRLWKRRTVECSFPIPDPYFSCQTLTELVIVVINEASAGHLWLAQVLVQSCISRMTMKSLACSDFQSDRRGEPSRSCPSKPSSLDLRWMIVSLHTTPTWQPRDLRLKSASGQESLSSLSRLHSTSHCSKIYSSSPCTRSKLSQPNDEEQYMGELVESPTSSVFLSSPTGGSLSHCQQFEASERSLRSLPIWSKLQATYPFV